MCIRDSCGTGLASHEVAQGYKEVKVTTITAKFKRKDADEYFLAWTTTPWTLASNVSLTVGPDVDYIKVKMISDVYKRQVQTYVMEMDDFVIREAIEKELARGGQVYVLYNRCLLYTSAKSWCSRGIWEHG